MMLVTIFEASDHLRRDTTADDDDLLLKIWAASQAVLTYIKNDPRAFEQAVDSSGSPIADSNGDPVLAIDSNGDRIPKWDVKAATLLLIGEFYKSREGAQEGEIDQQWGYGYLPRAVVALLYPYRDPAYK